MSRILRFNCKELYKSGVYLNAQACILDKLINEMKSITDNMKNVWSGIDYEKFRSNFSEYLSSIEKLEISLIDKASLIKSVAVKHGNIDKDLYNNLNRGNNNEQ